MSPYTQHMWNVFFYTTPSFILYQKKNVYSIVCTLKFILLYFFAENMHLFVQILCDNILFHRASAFKKYTLTDDFISYPCSIAW